MIIHRDEVKVEDLILEDAIKILNEALVLDGYAIEQLFRHRVECNESLTDHPHIVTGEIGRTKTLSTLGLINGIIGSLTGHRIAMMVPDDKDSPIGFTKYKIPTN
jgi:hypothetical protein